MCSEGIFTSVDTKNKPMALENKVTRKILELKLGCIRTLKNILNVKLHYLYFSQNIIRVIKSRRMGKAQHGHVRGGEKYISGFSGDLNDGDNFEEIGREETIISKYV